MWSPKYNHKQVHPSNYCQPGSGGSTVCSGHHSHLLLLGESSFFWFSLIQEEGRCLECSWSAPHGKATCGKWGSPLVWTEMGFPIGTFATWSLAGQSGFEIQMVLLIWASWGCALGLAVPAEATPCRIHGNDLPVAGVFSGWVSVFLSPPAPQSPGMHRGVPRNTGFGDLPPESHTCDVKAMSASHTSSL